MSGAFDRAALELVETAYRLDGSERAWMRSLLDASIPLLRPDAGILGTTFQVSREGFVTFTSGLVHTADVPDGIAEFLSAMQGERTPLHVGQAMLDRAPLDTASAAYQRFYGRDFSRWEFVAGLRDMGLQDQLVAKAYDPTGAGCFLLAQMRDVHAQPTEHTETWDHVLSHLLAAMRLRRALASSRDEAVLAPDGRLLHAEEPAQSQRAREALRAAALSMDRARCRGKRDATRALEEWRALVDGRWSLVDSFESDGRRYLVARQNDPRIAFPRKLSDRERQVASYAARGYSNKFIAYALGLSASTVSSHLNAAMRRLGARHRGELAALLSLGED